MQVTKRPSIVDTRLFVSVAYDSILESLYQDFLEAGWFHSRLGRIYQSENYSLCKERIFIVLSEFFYVRLRKKMGVI